MSTTSRNEYLHAGLLIGVAARPIHICNMVDIVVIHTGRPFHLTPNTTVPKSAFSQGNKIDIVRSIHSAASAFFLFTCSANCLNLKALERVETNNLRPSWQTWPCIAPSTCPPLSLLSDPTAQQNPVRNLLDKLCIEISTNK